jgi:predicted nucleic acid-binding protein
MLVLDTSVILNLLGSGRPHFLLSYFPLRALAPLSVIQEVTREPDVPVDKDASFLDLIDRGLIAVLDPNNQADELALSLAGGPSPDDLDDGESYAIAYAVTLQSALAIDERKGRRIISQKWPGLSCMFTLEVIEKAIAAAATLTDGERSAIIFSALRHSRMRVPANRRADIIQLIGKDLARTCTSLGSVPD